MSNEHVHPIFQLSLQVASGMFKHADKTPESLYRKYVGGGPVDIKRLRACVLNECRNAEHGVTKVSRDLLRELRADRMIIGRYAKFIGEK